MISDLFSNKPKDVKGIRNALILFIKEQLQKAEGGEGANIRGLDLFIFCEDDQKHLYESALFIDEPNRFKEEEVQKIADDYAIDLPGDWKMEIAFTKTIPEPVIRAANIDVALFISTQKTKQLYKQGSAKIKVLKGNAAQLTYILDAGMGQLNIGREADVQTSDGFYRKNNIAFVGDDESNRSISRQHGHIEWDETSGSFILFADAGGIPPYNKLKVREQNGNVSKLQSIEIGHRLKDGDQVLIGDSAVLEFFDQEDNSIS